MKIIFTRSYLISVVLFAISICSCGIRPSSKGNNYTQKEGKYYLSFFKQANEFVYFIKPIRFTSNEILLELDFTFTKKSDTIIDSVIVNYSILSKTQLSNNYIQSITFNQKDIAIGKFLFNNPLKNKYQLRHSTKIPIEIYKAINDTLNIRLSTRDKTFTLLPKDAYAKKVLTIMANI